MFEKGFFLRRKLEKIMNKIHSDNNSVYYVDDMCSCIFLITFNSISLGKNGGILHVVELGRGEFG